jgi:thiamine monophosphate synthase
VRRLDAGWLIGRSIHQGDPPGVLEGADYGLFGSVYETASKPGLPPAGLRALRAAVAASAVPVIAIGGIDVEGAEACAREGAAGIAAIRLFLPEGTAPGALGPARAVAALRAALARGSGRGDSAW